ncbi:MAG TPA: LytTR family DNA-binding domain-containing protein [bacterium]|nr:LytTR family DNA-binding domain-containing protein [bacterium]
MNVLIIEDEKPAGERLVAMVHDYDPAIRIVATLHSVKEARGWFAKHNAPDVILADIQLNDGLSLEIFKDTAIHAPIIFTTAFDEYLIKAFEFNSIDYLLKPIQKPKLFHALDKYVRLRQHFTGSLSDLLAQMSRSSEPSLQRIVVQKGTDFIAVPINDVAYFFTEHKMVFLVDARGKKFIVDKPLADLEAALDKQTFFRLNRKYIARISAIVRFKPYEKGKIKIELQPGTSEDIIVSQENAADFKNWMGK